MSFNAESYQVPFYAKSGNFIRGRDPLGIQNSSISVYASLLPGMTNLTLRLRYYGFYLWLLDEYDTLPEESEFKASPAMQYTFVRRGELLISFLMVNRYPEQQSVVGSDFANRNIDQASELGYYDLQKGADKTKETPKGSVYWDYNSGALGQYYAGSLMALNLMDFNAGYFHRTEDNGQGLANAYRESIGKNAAELFIKRIKDGKLYLDDLSALDTFRLNLPLNGTTEGAYYLDLLLGPDDESRLSVAGEFTYQRKQTLGIFLRYLNDENTEDYNRMPAYLYEQYLKSDKLLADGAELGWWYYRLNELVHFSLEAIFWGMLVLMEQKPYTVAEFQKMLSTEIINHSKVQGINLEALQTVGEFLPFLRELKIEGEAAVHGISSAVKGKEAVTAISEGVLSLLNLYVENEEKIDSVNQFVANNGLQDKHGNALEVFDMYIKRNVDLTFSEFTEKMVRRILMDHTSVAYNKMGDGQRNLLKFMIEDGILIPVELMEPNFTSPRIRALRNFCRDLGLVDDQNALTDEGRSVLNQLNA